MCGLGKKKTGTRIRWGALLAALCLCSCAGKQEQEPIVVVDQEGSSMMFDFVLAEPGDVIKTERLACTYKQTSEQEVSFSVSGRIIDKVYVQEGDQVTKGTLLAELASEDMKREVEDLEYRIARNQVLLDNIEESQNYDLSGQWVNFLYYTGGTADDAKNRDRAIEDIKQNYQYQIEDYTDAMALDRKKRDTLKRSLSGSYLYAQMDGAVYKLKKDLEGATSKQGEAVMYIIDTSECLFEAVNPEFAQVFSADDEIEMNISYGNAAGSYVLKPYHMEEWGESQFFEVVDGPDSRSELEVGTSGTMKVVVERRENVLCIPHETLHMADGKAFVYVLNEDGMRDIKWVEAGLDGDSMVEIRSGLAEGEKVIRK